MALIDPKLAAFLSLIAFSEGTSTHPLTTVYGYDVIVSGLDGPEVFDDFRDHPFANGRAAKVIRRVPLLTSTASGRYQLLSRFWKPYRWQLQLPDFTPHSQDLVALQQIRERGATHLILDGDIKGAIAACSNIWASFPGNQYGQGGKTMDELTEKYAQLLAQGEQDEA